VKKILESKRIQALVISFLVLLSVFLVTFNYSSSPRVWGDEGVFTETARNLALKGTLSLQVTPSESFSMRSFLLSTGYPVIVPVALFMKIFGVGLAQARITMLLYMLLLVLSFYLYSRGKYGFWVGVVSSLLLLSFSPFYGNGRPVQGEVPGLALFVMGSVFLMLWQKNNFQDKKYLFWSGLFFGLSSGVKPTFLILIAISLFVNFVFNFKKLYRKDTWLFLLPYISLVLVWFKIHFPTIKSLYEFFYDIKYFAGTHESGVSTISTITTNLLRFFKESTPVLFMFIFAVTLVTVALKFIKKERGDFWISDGVILSVIIINWSGYLFGTGWYRYFFPANILVYLFLVPSILYLANSVSNEWLKKVVRVIPILIILLQLTQLFFISENSFRVTWDANSDLRNTLSKVDSTKTIVFYDTNDATIFLKSENYYEYFNMGGFLEVGDKDIVNKIHPDYVLTDRVEDVNFSLSCYSSTKAGRYYFLEKIKDCPKK
jgi:4-amino-4-deoxy-L-arabinose transferase-like glycosyltransferase